MVEQNNLDVTPSQTIEKKKVAVALQGGGAHGAFAWGVLDRLLEDGRFDILGVSGTSAGGMNAASVIQGLIKGDEQTARETLHAYWKGMHEMSVKVSPYMINQMLENAIQDTPMAAHLNLINAIWQKSMPFILNPFDNHDKPHNLNKTPMFQWIEMLNSVFSPYDLNPKNKNPFADFVESFFDFESIRNSTERQIFLGTTHVKTGKIKIFSNKDISTNVLMASACLPFIFQAVEVDGEHYWDGGFIANPAIYPLISNCKCKDVIVVQLTRANCDNIPTTRGEIVDRLKEITYNGCLVREMRAIYFITKLIDAGIIKEGTLSRLNMHMIKNEDTFKNLNLSSALNTDWDFLTMLRDEGRKAASKWIKERFDFVGADNATIDEEMFADFVS